MGWATLIYSIFALHWFFILRSILEDLEFVNQTKIITSKTQQCIHKPEVAV